MELTAEGKEVTMTMDNHFYINYICLLPAYEKFVTELNVNQFNVINKLSERR
jgi:hypothetical protein